MATEASERPGPVAPYVGGAPQDRGAGSGATTIVIEAARGWPTIGWSELWRFRELLFFFVWRDLKVRYKQTLLGVLWVVIQPLILMLIFTLLLGRVAGLSKGEPPGIPYSLLVFAGLVPWTLFSAAISAGALVLVTNAPLVTKVYFPRLLLPIASCGSFVVDLVLSLCVLLVLMARDGIYPDWRVVALPGLALLTIVAAVGLSLWLTALNSRYRDVRYIVPFMLQIWLFLSPISYSSTRIPGRWRLLYDLNPMAGVVEGFRWALLGTSWQLGALPLISITASFVILVSGAYFFRNLERTFADEM
jgi:lipopolysaccharide transport system permease protein